MEPRPVPTILPLRSAVVRIADVFGAMIAVARGLDRLAPMIFAGAPAANAKVVGASPAKPLSIAPALSASRSGAAAGNCFHSTRYGKSLSTPAASMTACAPPFWSPILRIVSDEAAVDDVRKG